ncbi:MAG: hypothetical protein WB949_10075 [Candidatus Acidiferrales bacterium]
MVDQTAAWLDSTGDRTWLRSRSIVITFEECWPLAATLSIERDLQSKQTALLNVTKSIKAKDAAGLGALAHAYAEGDQSALEHAPNTRFLRIAAEAIRRSEAFFEWALTQSQSREATNVILCAQRYLPAATWQWDKACILAGALLATSEEMPTITGASSNSAGLAFWVALDKHTPQGKAALAEVAITLKSTYRQLIWSSFYCESARVNQLAPSPWWDAEKKWRLQRAGLTIREAEDLWLHAGPLVACRLDREADSLQRLVQDSRESLEETDPTFSELGKLKC